MTVTAPRDPNQSSRAGVTMYPRARVSCAVMSALLAVCVPAFVAHAAPVASASPRTRVPLTNGNAAPLQELRYHPHRYGWWHDPHVCRDRR